jgi:hypothetical protein
MGGYGGGFMSGMQGGGSQTPLMRRYRGRGPKGYSRSDERIREEISERLMEDPDIDASEIDVQVKDGEITLSGTVDSRQTKRQVEDLCEDALGVKNVQNNLRVKKEGEEEESSRGSSSSGSRAGTSGSLSTAGSSGTSGSSGSKTGRSS